MSVQNYKQGVVTALRGFAARSRSRIHICDCGLEFSEKRDYYRHKNGRHCLAKEVKPPKPVQLNLFGGKR